MANRKLLTAMLFSAVAAGSVQAGAFDETRFSFGAELSLINRTAYTNANTADLNAFKSSNGDSKLAIRKNKAGVNIFFAARFAEFIGGEIGFGFIQKVSAGVQNSQQATNKISNIYADLVGFMPVARNVDLIGAVGVGRLKSKANVSNYTFNNKQALNKAKVSFRIGGGAQYNFTDNWSTRGMIRYQKGSNAFLKSDTSVSVGAFYTF